MRIQIVTAIAVSTAVALSACDSQPAVKTAPTPIAATAAPTPSAMGGPPRTGTTAPAAQTMAPPVNAGPNPYSMQIKWAQDYDGDSQWGSVTAIQMAADGEHIWAANRCGANSCVGSDINPIALLRSDGTVVKSFGKGLFAWPHGMEVDAEDNVWVTDARSATAPELALNPDATNLGHTVRKFSPEGELLLTIGTPGETGLPPTHLNEPNDVLVAPNGNIYIAQAHRAQYVDGFGPNKNNTDNPDAFGRISIFAPDGSYIRSFGDWGYGPGQFRTPHAMALDSQGRLFVGDRGNRRLQIFTLEGEHLDTWYQFSRISGMYIAPDDTLYAIDSESGERTNPGWSKGLRIGNAKTGDVHYFIPPHFTNENIGPGGPMALGEGVTADMDGNIYSGELGPDRVRGITKFVKVLESIE